MDIKKLFVENPKVHNDLIYCFGNERDGDYFDESDFQAWENNDLYTKRCEELQRNSTSRFLLDTIINNESFIVDLATGPSMGFVPAIKKGNASIHCGVTDANLQVIEKHSQCVWEYSPIDFMQFSALQIPFKDNSINAYSSFIGISSTRNGVDGYKKALSEIYRTLKKGGRFYTIENNWTNVPQILELFKKTNKQPWVCFLEESWSWDDLFMQAGFKILYKEVFESRKLKSSDNELGEMAEENQVDIELRFEGFILEKV